MKLVKPSFEILEIMGGLFTPLELIEVAGRTCYKSETRITKESSHEFVQKLNRLGHESVIEHSAATVRFIVDRGVTHELVRHRLCAFSQESTRYCNYKGGVTFVIPPWVDLPADEYDDDFDIDILSPEDRTWYIAMINAEIDYKVLLNKWSLQQARSVLPNSLKTEIVVTTNFREWKHIFTLRTSKAAHPQMREIMIPLLQEFKELIPIIFDSINPEE
jgi:thymidylate synthase (FAD)